MELCHKRIYKRRITEQEISRAHISVDVEGDNSKPAVVGETEPEELILQVG